MVFMVLLLTLMSCALEFILAFRYPLVFRLLVNSIFLNLIVSMALSIILAMLFNAGGLIAMTAGISSTVISAVTYRLTLKVRKGVQHGRDALRKTGAARR